jgi:outer membrane protein TolC
VRKKIYQIEESVANYISAQANVALAEQTINLTSQQLDVGYSTIYDCQISYDQFIQALNGKNKARFELIKAYFGLKHASGADLEEKNVSK